MKVAYHTITWGSTPLPAVLDDIAAVGYRAFETFGLDRYFDRPADFRKILEPCGLTLSSVHFGASMIDEDKVPDELSAAARLAAFLREMGCAEMVLGGGRKKEDGNPESDYRVMADTANRMGEICRKNRLRLCYHPHAGTMVEHPDQLDRFMTLTDPSLVYLCPDTAHLQLGGADPAATVRSYADRVAYMHLKDLHGGTFVELGEGEVDLEAVLQVLKANHYNGWLVVELDSTRRTPKESAEMNARYLRDALGLVL